jgi:hypothetical protein
LANEDNTNEPAEPATAIELDEWWRKYSARVNKAVLDAEQHLQVPTGTILSILDDADFIATVKTYAVIEPMLNEVIASYPPRPAHPSQFEDYSTFVTALNMLGRAGKLKLAEGLGLITQDRVRFIEAVYRVRNRYAHNVKNMHRSLTEILIEERASREQTDGIERPNDGNARRVSDCRGTPEARLHCLADIQERHWGGLARDGSALPNGVVRPGEDKRIDGKFLAGES